MVTNDSRLRINVFGAPLNNPNLGLTALSLTLIEGLAARLPGPVSFTVVQPGQGIRSSSATSAADVRELGANASRRITRTSSHGNIALRARWGWIPDSAESQALTEGDVFIDVSGGDSFTDLYGAERFRAVNFGKRLAARLGVPLLLAPQTYGPFRHRSIHTEAMSHARYARQAWARDRHSYETLRRSMPTGVGSNNLHLGVDMAFGLAQVPIDDRTDISNVLHRSSSPIVGFNISGLLFNDPHKAAQFGLRADYAAVITGAISGLLNMGAHVLLIPHVIVRPEKPESDIAAGRKIYTELRRPQNLEAIEGITDPRKMKWLISRCDWFCGTRMHSTIAALSSGVPTAGLAYSDKMLGVFETCGSGDSVIDLRRDDTASIVARILASYQNRQALHRTLSISLPETLSVANTQLDEMAVLIRDIRR